jgi:zinc protease
MSTVREKEGLTYGIYARTIESHRKNTIHWNIYTFFTARDLQKGIASTLRELTSIVEKGITEEELRIFKEISLNQFILNHESNATRLGFYHGLSLLGYEEKDGVQFQEQLMKLTVHDVNTALRTYLEPDRLVIVGVGPVKEDGTGITT